MHVILKLPRQKIIETAKDVEWMQALCDHVKGLWCIAKSRRRVPDGKGQGGFEAWLMAILAREVQYCQ
jgi:hypothetical protein